MKRLRREEKDCQMCKSAWQVTRDKFFIWQFRSTVHVEFNNCRNYSSWLENRVSSKLWSRDMTSSPTSSCTNFPSNRNWRATKGKCNFFIVEVHTRDRQRFLESDSFCSRVWLVPRNLYSNCLEKGANRKCLKKSRRADVDTRWNKFLRPNGFFYPLETYLSLAL